MRRWISLPSPERYVEEWEVVEQVGDDEIYRETGAALDLLQTALRDARRSREVDPETRDALDRAEIALDAALDSRAGEVAEQVREDLDLPDPEGSSDSDVEEAYTEVDA